MSSVEWPALVWNPTRRAPALDADGVHVWRTTLQPDVEAVAALGRILNAAERTRAARYVRRRDRDAFVAARGTLRRILGSYLALAPEALEFGYNEFGKPYLRNRGHPALHFNVSHSGAIALYAFSIDRQVGIDVEQIKPGVELDSIAQRYFTAAEALALHSLPPEHQPAAFYRLWVRKEAYLKATGRGLSARLDHFEIPVAVDATPSKVLVNEPVSDQPAWWLRDLPLGHDYAAALVVAGILPEVECWIAATDWAA
jgi:4'-phosphopantetheinyl transferase